MTVFIEIKSNKHMYLK